MENMTLTNPAATGTEDASGTFDSLHTRLEAAGEKLGEFKPYDALNVPAEIEGTRIVKCLYKADKDGKKKRDNVYVRVPTAHITEDVVSDNVDKLAEYVVTFLQEIEDKGIKKAHATDQTQIYTDYLSLEKVIEALEESEAGARLNGEKIKVWFAENLEETLSLVVMDKLGIVDTPTEEQASKVLAIVDAYRTKFASLASGKTMFKEADRLALIKAIGICEAGETLLGRKFITRLEGMTEKEKDALLAL